MSVLKLLRCVMRLPDVTIDRLDQLARTASRVLLCEVPRAAVVRAVVETWLDAAEDCDPLPIIEAIRTAMVKRGRKKQRQPSQARRACVAQEDA